MIEKVVFIGSKRLGLGILKELCQLDTDRLKAIITYNDSADSRNVFREFCDISSKLQKPLYIIAKPSELNKVIDEIKPDMGIVSGWYWLIKQETLIKVPEGLLGVHASLLPRYRGFAPLVWQIINGETEGGISLFHFDEGMDSGDIVVQRKFEINFNDTIADLITKSENLSTQIISENYPLLLNGTAPRFKQNHDEATYCGQRKPEDGHIDWSRGNYEIYNFIRAQSPPYPGAFTWGDNIRYTVLKASIFPQAYYGIPGQVVLIESNRVVVSCGQGAVNISDIRLDDGKIYSAAKILKFGMRLK